MRFVRALFSIAAAAALAGTPGITVAQIVNSAPQPATSQPDQIRLYDRTQIIVKFRPDADPTAVMRAATADDRESYREDGGFGFTEQATGATLVDLSGILIEREQTTGLFGVERPQAEESKRNEPLDDLLARLNADPAVEYAQKNYLMQPFDTADLINEIISGQKPPPNDPYLGFQLHLMRHAGEVTETDAPGAVNFPAAWAKHQPRRQVVVAVVDTGQIYDHQDVDSALLLPGYDFVSHPFIGNDGDGRDNDATDSGDGTADGECFAGSQARDDTWHGSHVSGIAGLAATDNEVGIASPVPSGIAFVPVRALGRCGGTTADLVDAVLWAAGIEVPGAPVNQNPALVINGSFGGPADGCDPAFQDALRQLRERGAILVAAAGNSSDDSARYSPSSCTDAFTVAASDIKGALAPYSNYGSAVDILAPGGDITQDLNGDGFADGVLSIVADGYSFYNGTSMAAPLVSAAIALALTHNPGWTVTDAMNRLNATAKPRSGAQCAEPCGAGLMDVSALLD